MSSDQMSDFRSPVDRTFCEEYCDDERRFPTDNCRRCWIDIELTKLRHSWYTGTDPNMLKFAWCVEDSIGYSIGRAVRGDVAG